MFPVKGDVQACLVPCLARHLQRFFSLCKRGKMQAAVCLQDKWLEAFPCWFSEANGR